MIRSDLITKNDHELWKQVASGDDLAFKMLFNKFWPTLTTYAKAYLDDRMEREEVMQDLFVELYLKRGKINVHTSLSAFMQSFARNRILNFIRNQSTYRRHLRGAALRTKSSFEDIDERIDFAETKDKIYRTLAEMPDRYREVYLLKREFGCTLNETASILKRPLPTVEKQYRKAFRLMKARIVE